MKKRRIFVSASAYNKIKKAKEDYIKLKAKYPRRYYSRIDMAYVLDKILNKR